MGRHVLERAVVPAAAIGAPTDTMEIRDQPGVQARASSPAAVGFWAATSWPRSRRAAAPVLVPRKAQYDLTREPDVERMYADLDAGGRHPPGGRRRRHRRQPRLARPLLLRERHDRGADAGAGAADRRREVRRHRHDLRLPEDDAGPVSRARPVERLPGRDQRRLRHREEDAAGPGPGVPAAVRLQCDPPAAGQPVRAARQLRSAVVARHPGADPQVRRGGGGRRAGGRVLGHRQRDARVSVRRGLRRSDRRSRRSATTARSR